MRARARAICGRETDGCGSGSGSGNSRGGWVIRILECLGCWTGDAGMLGCWRARRVGQSASPYISRWTSGKCMGCMYRCTYVYMCIVYGVYVWQEQRLGATRTRTRTTRVAGVGCRGCKAARSTKEEARRKKEEGRPAQAYSPGARVLPPSSPPPPRTRTRTRTDTI